MLIDGIHVPLTVPFARDGGVAVAKLESNVRRYSLGPVAGLVALAPGGEAGSLSDGESAEVLQAVAHAASEEKVLVAGVMRESVAGALALIQAAADAGFDAALVAAPALSDAERHIFFRAVADRAALPVMLWSDAARPLPPELVAEMARHPQGIGLYDAGLNALRLRALEEATAGCKREVAVTHVFAPATRRLQAAARADQELVSPTSLREGGAVVVSPARAAVKLRSKTVGFQIMTAGTCTGMLELLQAGVAGAMPTLSACAPQAVYEIYAAFKDGDPALSAEKAARVLDADSLVTELGVAGVKYACDVNGYAGGPPRLPRLPLTAAERERVDRVLAEIRN